MKHLQTLLSTKFSICLFVLLSCFACSSSSQSKGNCIEHVDYKNRIYQVTCFDKSKEVITNTYIDTAGKQIVVAPHVEKIAAFGRGAIDEEQYAASHLRWDRNRYHGNGKVLLAVLIAANGRVREARLVRGLDWCLPCSQEALHMARQMPLWQPASVKGIEVASVRLFFVPFLQRYRVEDEYLESIKLNGDK